MTLYEPDRVKIILHALRHGATHKLAAHAAGIADRTMREWRARHEMFDTAVREAEAHAAVKALERIESAAQSGIWQASAWLLERRYPSMYGRFPENARAEGAEDRAEPGSFVIEIGEDPMPDASEASAQPEAKVITGDAASIDIDVPAQALPAQRSMIR
jgi:hypothetical protein